jgi:hypothetical protein
VLPEVYMSVAKGCRGAALGGGFVQGEHRQRRRGPDPLQLRGLPGRPLVQVHDHHAAHGAAGGQHLQQPGQALPGAGDAGEPALVDDVHEVLGGHAHLQHGGGDAGVEAGQVGQHVVDAAEADDAHHLARLQGGAPVPDQPGGKLDRALPDGGEADRAELRQEAHGLASRRGLQNEGPLTQGRPLGIGGAGLLQHLHRRQMIALQLFDHAWQGRPLPRGRIAPDGRLEALQRHLEPLSVGSLGQRMARHGHCVH